MVLVALIHVQASILRYFAKPWYMAAKIAKFGILLALVNSELISSSTTVAI